MPDIAVAQTASKAPPPIAAPIVAGSRRFELPDLNTHGGWMIPRLAKIFPHLTEQQLAGFLRGIINDTESLFLYRDNAIALAQIVRSHTMQPEPAIWERFVLARSEEHADEAAEFYTDFARWAKHHGASVIVCEEQTDVPHDSIKEKLGRLFERKQVFARV